MRNKLILTAPSEEFVCSRKSNTYEVLPYQIGILT